MRFSLCLRPVFLLAAVVLAHAQSSNVPNLLTAAIDENQLVTLTGNTHPLAKPAFDKGAAPVDLPMERMLLVLKRSPQQEAALAKLLADQQTPGSPDYHHWLTPQEFGQRFGVSDQDLGAITAWLQSHGFTVNNVSNGRTLIEFSGNAAQVEYAFHTPIHQFVINGESHWANAQDPQLPMALAPAVAGVASFSNFISKPQVQFAPQKVQAHAQ
ncbi:MAG: peptidase S53, partial [Acidobacteriaceae bacterium]|nr:peptidase S53 [Acidobacteriaceae bacterium]